MAILLSPGLGDPDASTIPQRSAAQAVQDFLAVGRNGEIGHAAQVFLGFPLLGVLADEEAFLSGNQFTEESVPARRPPAAGNRGP